MANPSISLCMIIKDEEDFLRMCLESIKPLVDEIIVIDTGSKDNSIKIAKSFGAKIIEHKWNNDFSEARNISLKHATKDWILVLDADEKISDRDFEKIRDLLKENKYNGFYLVQRNYIKNKVLTAADVSSESDDYLESKAYTGWDPVEIIRIFRNNKGYQFKGIIHESVKESILSENGKLKKTDIPIHHFREEKKQVSKIEKTKKYHDLSKKQAELKPNDPKPLYDLGLMYITKNNPKEAIIQFKKAIKIIDELKIFDKPLLHASILISLGEAYIKEQKYKDANNCLNKALDMFPQSPIVFSLLGKANRMQNKLAEAIVFYQKAVKIKPDSEGMHCNLIDLYLKQGDLGHALRQTKIALQYLPNSAVIYRNQGVVYLKMNRFPSAYESFMKSIKINHGFEKELKSILKKLESVKNSDFDVEYSFSID